MSKIANLDSVKQTLANRTGYEISKLTGVTEAGVGKWRNGGEEQILKMSFDSAIKLTELYGHKATEHFNEVKEMFYQSIPGLITKDPEIATQNIISQVEMLLEALSAKKEAESTLNKS